MERRATSVDCTEFTIFPPSGSPGLRRPLKTPIPRFPPRLSPSPHIARPHHFLPSHNVEPKADAIRPEKSVVVDLSLQPAARPWVKKGLKPTATARARAHVQANLKSKRIGTDLAKAHVANVTAGQTIIKSIRNSEVSAATRARTPHPPTSLPGVVAGSVRKRGSAVESVVASSPIRVHTSPRAVRSAYGQSPVVSGPSYRWAVQNAPLATTRSRARNPLWPGGTESSFTFVQ